MWIRSLGREDPLEEGMATHSSILAWRTPWTEESGGLQSMGVAERNFVMDMTEHTCTAHLQEHKAGKINLNIIFHLIPYFQHMITSTYHPYKKTMKTFYVFFFILSLQKPVFISCLNHISVQMLNFHQKHLIGFQISQN